MHNVLDAVPESISGSFFDLLAEWKSVESVGTDDLIPAVLPLFEQVLRQHEQGNVAPLDGVDQLRLQDGRVLWFNASDGRPCSADEEMLVRLDRPPSDGIDVVGEIDFLENDEASVTGNRRLAKRGQIPDQPLYYLDYTSWEMVLGHQDALSDIFALGMILGSLATRLDFTKHHELEQFLTCRRNVHAGNPRIHPVVSRLIAHMTEVRRADRAQDLSAIIETLDNYRRSEADDFEDRLAQLEAITDPAERRKQIQSYLRNRLFEISHRNRLVYFKETTNSANLTVGSLPYTLSYRSIKANQLLLGTEEFCKKLDRHFEAEPARSWFSLGEHVRFEEYPFLSPTVDKIRLQAQSDTKEYGFSQLRLVLAFLRWHNLVRDKEERIQTPLILLPVELRKRSGSEHGFDIRPVVSPRNAEINPALRHLLQATYGIELPREVDLTDFANVRTLHERLERAIQRRHAGVTIQVVTKPRIQIIHRTVRRQVEDYNRRRNRTGRGLKEYAGITYSYDPANFAPLGLTLFNQYVRVRAAPDRAMAGQGTPDEPSSAEQIERERETNRDFYVLDDGNATDPMNWEIDLTAVTLSNFNYRKMSLVRDYADLIAGAVRDHVNFDRLFSSNVRAFIPEMPQPGFLERYNVLPTDPSQDAAIFRARSGTSYVIQGPPGTGKSQTIANLLADFAARGKKVLFICEKRVAIDVVFHRLAEAGLQDLTCLIHDAKEDKKPFIAEVKRIYEAWREVYRPDRNSQNRKEVVDEIHAIIAELEEFSRAMAAPAVRAELSLRKIIDLTVAKGGCGPVLDAAAREFLPAWPDLARVREAILEIERIAGERLPPGMNAQQLLRFMHTGIARRDRLLSVLDEAVRMAQLMLSEIESLDGLAIAAHAGSAASFDDLLTQCSLALELQPLAQSRKLRLLDPRSLERAQFVAICQRLTSQGQEIAHQEREAVHWSTRLLPHETEMALRIARLREGRLLSFLRADWRRVQRRIQECYRGEVFSYVAVLEQLASEHAARASHEKEMRAIAIEYGFADLVALQDLLARFTEGLRSLSPSQRVMIEQCVKAPEITRNSLLALATGSEDVSRARDRLDGFLHNYSGLTPTALREYLTLLRNHQDAVARVLPLVAEIESGAPNVTAAWRDLGLEFEALERATLIETIEKSERVTPLLARFDGQRLKTLASRLDKALTKLRVLNSRLAIETCREWFRQQMVGASEEYREGCRLLEHQFGLIRPSKSLRELLSAKSGNVLRDLKPIWMMSPLSVADTLPFDDELFDAVVFDEASQIPLEDAVPSLYRARQTIIVGDERQLPPTSFFSSSVENEEPVPDYLAYAINADSLLNKATTTLASVKLTWHYRSRHESVISFCNLAFYKGELNTVPARRPLKRAPEIVIDSLPVPTRLRGRLADSVLDRPVSLHRVTPGVFRNQQNEAEACYIAELVRSLLKKNSGMTLGVVAFSQSQAQAIEAAIDSLGSVDRQFARLSEKEQEREIDGQFCGLFVKNLENVQGDERDIIIVSVGYAPGPDGKMRMLLGPINQSGGERRLNVIFSRAKHNIAIVTSISHDAITNDFNVGANILKQYLRYAAAVSTGDEEEMYRCLSLLGGSFGSEHRDETKDDAVVGKIAADLTARGKVTARGLGHSALRIDVAARPSEQDDWEDAILVDTEEHYAIPDVVERYVTRPAILREFGWNVKQVLGKDFLLRTATGG